MDAAIVVGVVVGGLAALCLRRRAARVEEREEEARERVAAIILCDEVRAAIDAINLALKNEHRGWVMSMSDSVTLAEAWTQHADALQRLEAEHWYVLSDAVSALTPSPLLMPAGVEPDDLRRSLVQRRELLEQGLAILLTVRDRPAQDCSRLASSVHTLAA